MTPAPASGRTADENELRTEIIKALNAAFRGFSFPGGRWSTGFGSEMAADALLSGPLAPILQEAAISPRGRFIDGIEDLPSEEALTERGSFTLPDSVRYDIEREARNIVNVFAPDAPPALLQSIKAALLRAEKRRIRDVRAARVSNERPEAEDPKGLSPSGRQCDGEAGTPEQSAEQEAATLRARLQEAEKDGEAMRELCAREAERVVKVPARMIGGMRVERLPMAPRTPREIAAAIRDLPLNPNQEAGDA